MALGGVGEVSTIIPHFEKYPLITQKRVDFEFFKQAVHIMNNKEHLILLIKSGMNIGRDHASHSD
jgi:hypothetical protein